MLHLRVHPDNPQARSISQAEVLSIHFVVGCCLTLGNWLFVTLLRSVTYC